ncbi:MAG: hypothetical protein IJB28_07210 [Bacteroidaceae bacterium]|nr:hypothetical protein [Bacteroidaceae bacterium]MBQ6800299.1 hypothetical protein [Bacteroidaceae bacterium]
MAALDLQIEVPNMGVSEIEELKHKLMAYAKQLISLSQSQSRSTVAKKRYRHEALAGIFASQEDGNTLRDAYINEKYGL